MSSFPSDYTAQAMTRHVSNAYEYPTPSTTNASYIGKRTDLKAGSNSAVTLQMKIKQNNLFQTIICRLPNERTLLKLSVQGIYTKETI